MASNSRSSMQPRVPRLARPSPSASQARSFVPEMAGVSTTSYSCETAAKTLEWINAIISFIKPYSNSLINAPVVNFFTDKLWESINPDWIACLRQEPIENLLLIPSYVKQPHWPPSLNHFLLSLESLNLPRSQIDFQKVLPGLKLTSLNAVVSQGMNVKKKHEVEVLSAVVSYIAKSVGADSVVDVGAGQGYLAQVLSFEYKHSVIAIDALSHHGNVTNARAERIKKYYTAQMRKSGSGDGIVNVPKTVTCRVMSIDMLKDLTSISPHDDGDFKETELIRQVGEDQNSLVLAGLHACGDLSVTMLKTFLERKDVKAVVSIGCCYNLLSEGCLDADKCGFPMSCGVKSSGISLGRSSRDLACQSADRWRSLEKDAGLHNFELHAFRAAFQMVLSKHYPEVLSASTPSIGRQGKALRRQHKKEILHPSVHQENENLALVLDIDASSHGVSFNGAPSAEETLLFEKFSQSGLSRLGIKATSELDFYEVWKEAEPFAELIGPYWSLRAALGPVLETLLLLDRLLFLQEQGGLLEAVMLPIFNPQLSPRNVAIIAKRA